MFEKFKRTMLPKRYRTQATLNVHISKSIFLVVIGVNDINTIISIKNSTNPRAYVKNIDDIIWRLGGRLRVSEYYMLMNYLVCIRLKNRKSDIVVFHKPSAQFIYI